MPLCNLMWGSRVLATWIRHAFEQRWVCVRSYQRRSGHEARDQHVKDSYRPTLEECLKWAEAGGNVEVLLHESRLLQVDAEHDAPDPWGDPTAHAGACLSRSAGAGLHAVYAAPPGLPQRRWIKPVLGVDLLSKGVWPLPGCKRDGDERKQPGEWTALRPPMLPGAPPSWVLDALPKPPQERVVTPLHPSGGYALAALASECNRIASAPEGQRNQALARGAYRMGRIDQDHEAALEQLIEAARQAGLPEKEARSTATRCMDAGRKNPRAMPSLPDVVFAPESEPDRRAEKVLVPGGHPTPDGWVKQTPDLFAAQTIAALPAGVLYRRGNVAGELTGPPGEREFRQLETDRVRCLASRYVEHISWTKPRPTKSEPDPEPQERFVPLTKDLSSAISARAADHHAVRPLQWVSPYPFLGPDGLVTVPGYHAPGYYFDPPPGLIIPTVTEPAVIRAALLDLVVDFPFEDDASRDNFFGFLLTPLMRPAIDGNVPLFLFSAPLHGSGKTILARDVAGIIITGRPLDISIFPRRPENVPQWILSLALSGRTIVQIDNLPPEFDSGELAALITAKSLSDRILGASRWVTAPNTLSVALTGNNVRMSPELARRSVMIRLKPKEERPEDRSEFKHSPLEAYLRQVRPQILGCLLGAIRLWMEAGRPMPDVAFGSFDGWRAVGGVLGVVGLTDWFGNRARWRRGVDSETDALEAFVRAWFAWGGGRVVRATDLLASLPAATGEILERPSPVTVGRLVGRMVDRQFGELRVERVGGAGAGEYGYRVVKG